MLEKIPRAMALRAMIVVSLIVCSPALLPAAESSSTSGGMRLPYGAPPGMPIGDDEY